MKYLIFGFVLLIAVVGCPNKLKATVADSDSIFFNDNIWEYRKAKVDLYTKSTELFITLSMAAIGLTVVFREKILGEKSSMKIITSLKLTWISYLLAIFCGALYNYFAVKFLFKKNNMGTMLNLLSERPGILYGAMLTFFFIGSIFLLISSSSQLKTTLNKGSL